MGHGYWVGLRGRVEREVDGFLFGEDVLKYENDRIFSHELFFLQWFSNYYVKNNDITRKENTCVC